VNSPKIGIICAAKMLTRYIANLNLTPCYIDARGVEIPCFIIYPGGLNPFAKLYKLFTIDLVATKNV